MAILDCRVSGLYVPLMAIVNYRGFSLIAQSHLPVNCNTVISGTYTRATAAAAASIRARLTSSSVLRNGRWWSYGSCVGRLI